MRSSYRHPVLRLPPRTGILPDACHDFWDEHRLQDTRAPHRLLIAKPGLDGHDRGAKVLIRAFQAAGYEVVYTGLRQTPAQIATAAVQEDVELVGLSILSGSHLDLTRQVVEELRRRGAGEVPLVVGGTMLKADEARLIELGAVAVFPMGTSVGDCVAGVAAILDGPVDAPR